MIAVAISVVVVFLVFKLMRGTREFGIDAPLAVVIAPAILSFLLSFAVAALNLPPALAYGGFLLYLLVPFAIMKWLLNASTGVAALAAVITCVTVVAATTGIAMVAGL